jgi:cellulose biosynthesis protein BcsQ
VSIDNSQLGKQSFASSFGERLKDAFGNSQNKEIATLLGVSNPAVTAYLRGRVPPAEKLVEIAKLTGYNLHWLLTGEGPKRVIYEAAQPHHAKTILFHCNKGGVGTSTAALLTAVGLASRGYKTLLVDNIFGSCTLSLFYRLLKNSLFCPPIRDFDKAPGQKLITKNSTDPDGKMFFRTSVSGLDLVSFDKNHQLILTKEKVHHFDLIPREVQDNYSYIVVDVHSHIDPFSPISLFMTLLLREAKVFIPFQPYNAMEQNIRTTLEYVDFAQRYNERIEFLGLFLSNYDTRMPMDEALRGEVESLTGDKLLHSMTHKTHELWDIIPNGLENFYQTKARIVREYSALITEILERLGAQSR